MPPELLKLLESKMPEEFVFIKEYEDKDCRWHRKGLHVGEVAAKNYNQARQSCISSLPEVIKAYNEYLIAELKKSAHGDIHTSMTWGVENKMDVVHLDDITNIINNLNK